MVTTTTNVSFQKWANNEEPWEQRTDWDKLDDIFSGVTTVPGFDVTTLTAEDLDIGSADLVSTGDFLAVGPSLQHIGVSISTTSTSYVNDSSVHQSGLQWDGWLPTGAQGAILSNYRIANSSGDVRLRNAIDNEDVFEDLDISAGTFTTRTDNYTPTTTDGRIVLRIELKTDDGGTSTVLQTPDAFCGVQV